MFVFCVNEYKREERWAHSRELFFRDGPIFLEMGPSMTSHGLISIFPSHGPSTCYFLAAHIRAARGWSSSSAVVISSHIGGPNFGGSWCCVGAPIGAPTGCFNAAAVQRRLVLRVFVWHDGGAVVPRLVVMLRVLPSLGSGIGVLCLASTSAP